jgi:archaellum component FlaC
MDDTPGIGQIIDVMYKRTINQNTILRIEENISNIELKLESIKNDTNKLSSLKDKLMFIEQFYINKTSIETDINCKIGRIEHTCEGFKRHIEILSKDVKFIKDHIKLKEYNKNKISLFTKIFKKNFLFTNKR